MSDNFEGDIQQIEVNIEDAREAVALQAALARLADNKDFELVITKGYFNLEAERVVGALADPAMKMNEVGMDMLKDQVISIGGLRQYFIKLQQTGNMAQEGMAAMQDTHTELLEEQMEEEGVH